MSAPTTKTSTHKAQIPNPLLAVRFLVFALLAFLNFQLLVFSAWNIHAALSASYPVPSATIFFIFNCCTLDFLVLIAMVEYSRPHTKTGQIKFELAWSGAISALYLGATVALTVDGSTARCRDSSVCTSASLLIPVAWATTLTLLVYFFGFAILIGVHLPLYPEIWHNTVYKFPWFTHPEELDISQSCASANKPDVEKGLTQFDVTSWTKRTKTLDPPSWATALKVRRGKDDPFANASKHQGTPMAAPSVPSKDSHTKESRPSRHPPESARTPITPSHADSPFPAAVDNQDIPIPLPRLSSWIHADARNGISIHTIPVPSP